MTIGINLVIAVTDGDWFEMLRQQRSLFPSKHPRGHRDARLEAGRALSGAVLHGEVQARCRLF